MLKIDDLVVGKSYACKFAITTMLDEDGSPTPNLSNKPLKGPGIYESLGVIMQRDLQNEKVIVSDTVTKQKFVANFSDIWDIDEVEWIEPLD